MTVITDTLRQIVRRRLWPVALLLVAALVAVPMTLAKSPDPVPPVPVATTAKAGVAQNVARPLVELREPAAGETHRRRVLGAAKDPFEPAPLPKAKKSKKVSKAEPSPTPTPEAPASSGPGSGAPGGSGGGTSAPPSAEPTPAPTVTIPKGSIKVRFGVPSETSELPELLIGRLEAVPSSDAPVLVLERLKDDGRTAVFSIPGDIIAVGDGNCQPTPDDCASLELRAGETEFVTVKGGAEDGSDVQYQLDLVKIFAKATEVPKDSVPVTDGATP
jgi:hypothetical protein